MCKAEFIDKTCTSNVNLMAVCDSQKRFSFIDAGYPGSAHDVTVFANTKLHQKLTTNIDSVLNSNINHLIGDSGFQLAPYLLTPYADRGNLDVTKIRYNKKLPQIRYIIEQAFSLLKGRIRRLKYLDINTSRIQKIIAACVLHNITLQYPEEDALMTDICILPSPPEIVALHLPAETAGSEKQEFIATIL